MFDAADRLTVLSNEITLAHQQTRPFRVRSPQSGIQVGLVAASLSELRMEVAEALEIDHPWFIRLLLVEPDGRGSTEILDERFFATVPPPPPPPFPFILLPSSLQPIVSSLASNTYDTRRRISILTGSCGQVPANSLLLALRAEAMAEKLVAVPKYKTREI